MKHLKKASGISFGLHLCFHNTAGPQCNLLFCLWKQALSFQLCYTIHPWSLRIHKKNAFSFSRWQKNWIPLLLFSISDQMNPELWCLPAMSSLQTDRQTPVGSHSCCLHSFTWITKCNLTYFYDEIWMAKASCDANADLWLSNVIEQLWNLHLRSNLLAPFKKSNKVFSG